MQQLIDLGPVELNYAAALRGVAPRAAGQTFRYIRAGRMDGEAMLCLAASNPEGDFLFLMDDDLAAAKSAQRAAALRLGNAAFQGVNLPRLAAELAGGGESIAPGDYFCADLQDAGEDALNVARALAPHLTRAGGLAVLRYKPFATALDGLRFMVAEFGPELQPASYTEFLHELKQLGHACFARYPEELAALDAALGEKNPEKFLQRHAKDEHPKSAVVATIAAMAPAGFDFVGEASVAGNYLEMMVPKPAQEMLYSLRGQLLYEAIKDFASARACRTDIWARRPAALSGDLAVLFGGFFFGLADMTGPLPAHARAGDQDVDLSAPVLACLLRLMQVMPVTIGDVLDHESGRGFSPLDIIMAVQILVACGVVAPMRGSFGGLGRIDMRYPRLAGQFNQQLRGAALNNMHTLLASTVAGRPLRLSLPEALVLQAVDRAGFEESADALMTELQRVAGNPAQAKLVFQAASEPAPDFAESLIRQVCEQNFVNWYALGVLDAA